jgi:RNA polymerase sigma factor (sigma-70 family)
MAEGSRERLEELVRQYGRLIRKVVARVGGRIAGRVDEDVEQTVVLRLWQQLEREQTIEHPASYIYRAAVRETIRVIQRENARSLAASDLESAESAPSASGDPFAALHAKERTETIAASIERLAPDRRRAVRAHLAGFDVAEVMNMYGWSYQKARNLIARGMADLRNELRERGIHG